MNTLPFTDADELMGTIIWTSSPLFDGNWKALSDAAHALIARGKAYDSAYADAIASGYDVITAKECASLAVNA